MSKLGQGLGTVYPNQIDTAITEVDTPAANRTRMRVAVPNDQNTALTVIENELGVNPQGSASSVAAFIGLEHTALGTHLKIWKRVQTIEVTSATSQITISGLDGDTDVMYWIFARLINTKEPANYFLQINGSSGASAYGSQTLSGERSSATASRNTNISLGMPFGYNSATSEISFSQGILYAKTGYIRTFNARIMDRVSIISASINTITRVQLSDAVWGNASSTITNIAVVTDVTAAGSLSCIGAGSFFEIWKMMPSS